MKNIDRLSTSDIIANFLKEKKIKHVFGIIGSANAHIFDSIRKLNYTQIVNVHHEQAATMAIQTYYRVTGKISAALITAGGATSNAITGVLSAWADSMPGLIITGQENSKFMNIHKGMRMWGIQGFDSINMVKQITKYSSRIFNASNTLYELEKSYFIALNGRPGPVWLDIPVNVKGEYVKKIKTLKRFKIKKNNKIIKVNEFKKLKKLINQAKRPVFWFGNGIRLSKSEKLVSKVIKKIPLPFFLSWAGIDLINSKHHLNFGRPGLYGNRASNLILQNSDLIIAVGTRLSIPMIGYVQDEFARKAKIIHVDIDKTELNKIKKNDVLKLNLDAKYFLNLLINKKFTYNKTSLKKWTIYCENLLKRFPHIERKAHKDTNGFINSYNFINKLSNYLKGDECIVTDMGTALLSGHQVISLKNNQRMMTSTGLGEMGYGLPGAIGASFGKNKQEIICLNCDGGIMMNLQELQTIDHYKLPIKIFIFNNDGYLMIKHTQKNLFGGKYTSVNKDTDVTCPDFKKVASAFNMKYFYIRTWNNFKKNMPKILKTKSPMIINVMMDPEQFFHPKLGTGKNSDNVIVSPPLEDLSPLLSREELNKSMIIPLHEKSKNLK